MNAQEKTLDSKETENKYSGSLQTGWNLDGSYHRIQYVSDKILTNSEITEIIIAGELALKKSENKSRLDIRCIVPINFDFNTLQSQFQNIDIAPKRYNGNPELHLTIGLNKEARNIPSTEILQLQKNVSLKIQDNLESVSDFENFSLQELEKIQKQKIEFENKNFSAEELEKLWGYNFGWNRDEIESFLEQTPPNNYIYGLRDNENNLIASLLISDGEATEWSVIEKEQGKGLIVPLLLHAYAHQIKTKGQNVEIYAQLRHNRSISPAIKSGMNIMNENGTQFILSNHVQVEDQWTSFVEASLNTKIFSPKIIQSYLQNNS